MTTVAQVFSEFATTLKFDDIPPAVIERAKDCVADTFAVCTFGSTLPSNKIVIDYAVRSSARGTSVILGTTHKIAPPHAAFRHWAPLPHPRPPPARLRCRRRHWPWPPLCGQPWRP